MAQWVKGLTVKAEDVSSIPKTCVKILMWYNVNIETGVHPQVHSHLVRGTRHGSKKGPAWPKWKEVTSFYRVALGLPQAHGDVHTPTCLHVCSSQIH